MNFLITVMAAYYNGGSDYYYRMDDNEAIRFMMQFLHMYFVILLVVIFIYAAINFIFYSRGVSALKEKYGISSNFAFIPIMSSYTYGQIAGEIYKRKTGRKSNMGICKLLSSVFCHGSLIIFFVNCFLFLDTLKSIDYVNVLPESVIEQVFANALILYLWAMLACVFNVINLVLRAICFNRIVKEETPKNATSFTVLMVVFGSLKLESYFLFSMRNWKALQEADPYYTQQQPYNPYYGTSYPPQNSSNGTAAPPQNPYPQNPNYQQFNTPIQLSQQAESEKSPEESKEADGNTFNDPNIK